MTEFAVLFLLWLLITACLTYARTRYKQRPNFKVYTSKDTEKGKLKVGIERVKASAFPPSARYELDGSFNDYRWDSENKFLRTAFLDPEDEDIDNALAEALGQAQSLIDAWESSCSLDALHDQAQRMLKK